MCRAELAHDPGKTGAPQSFLHGPEPLRLVPRLNEKDPVHIESESRQPAAIGHTAKHVGIPKAPEDIPATRSAQQAYRHGGSETEDARVPYFGTRFAGDFMNTAKGEATAKMMIQTLQAERTARRPIPSVSAAFNSPHLRTQRCQIGPLPDAVTALRIAHSTT